MQLRVSGVSSNTAPFELVLGQSVNAGWKATVDGHSLGAPVLVDGFANGWQLDPSTLSGAIHGGVLDVALRWTPQRGVDAALVVSGAAILTCLAIVLVSWRRRRRRRKDGYEEDEASYDHPVVGDGLADDGEPVLSGPVRGAGRTLPVLTSLWVATGCGVGAGVIAAPFTGVAVFAATLLALRVARVRWLLVIAGVACVAGGGAFVIAHQAADPAVANGGWPVGFGTASALVWAGVLFLGADAGPRAHGAHPKTPSRSLSASRDFASRDVRAVGRRIEACSGHAGPEPRRPDSPGDLSGQLGAHHRQVGGVGHADQLRVGDRHPDRQSRPCEHHGRDHLGQEHLGLGGSSPAATAARSASSSRPEAAMADSNTSQIAGWKPHRLTEDGSVAVEASRVPARRRQGRARPRPAG